MHEKESHSPASWQSEEIAQRLKTQAESESDVSYGFGYRFRFGTEQRFSLTIYPKTETVIFRSATQEWRMTRQAPPAIDEDGVRFTNDEDGSTSLFTVTPESGVAVATIAYPRAEAPESSPFPVSASSDALLRDGQEEAVSGDSVASERITDEEKQRVHLEGVVGRKPNYYETRKGTPVARFSVGEKTEAGSTDWHDVVAFKKWATYVRDSISKRDRVEIAGYPHEREVKAKDGTTKTVQEIYVGYLKKLNKS